MKYLLRSLVCVLILACGSSAFAAKEVFVRSKPHVNVGTLGLLDHGKLDLTAALAAASGNPLQTVDLRCESPDGSGEIKFQAFLAEVNSARADYSIFDFDDEGTILNMVAGPVIQDGSILVVSAADGPMPQTREHILLARQTGVPAVVVFLNLDGATSPAQIDGSVRQVRDLLSEVGYAPDQVPLIKASVSDALRGGADGLLALADLMDALDKTTVRR